MSVWTVEPMPLRLVDARDLQFRRLEEENADLRELLCQNSIEIRELKRELTTLRDKARELDEIKAAWGMAEREV